MLLSRSSLMKRNLELLPLYVLSVIVLTIPTENVQATGYKRFYLKALHGSFNSPNYPNSYPKDVYYEWIFPFTSQELQLEFIKMDLSQCFNYREFGMCDQVDHVFIQGYKSYCSWEMLPKTIILKPWTKALLAFYSYNTKVECKGKGFKVIYKPFDRQRYETTPTANVVFDFFTHRTDNSDSSLRGTHSSPSFSIIFLLVLLAIPLILIAVCVYWCCRKGGRPSSLIVNERVPQSHISNGRHPGGQSGDTSSREHPVRGETIQNSNYPNDGLLTVNLPADQQPQPSIASTNNTIGYFDQRYPDHGEGNMHGLDENINYNPPPSYDDVWENVNRSCDFECPPSYETAINETLRQSRESVNQATEGDTQENAARINIGSNSTRREANSSEIYI